MAKSLTNAHRELLQAIDGRTIKCAVVNYYPCSLWEINELEAPHTRELRLKVGHDDKDLLEFFKQLDFNYDNGYGGQELFGMIWLNGGDGAWLTRGEYDGSEWWDLNKLPEIPKELLTP